MDDRQRAVLAAAVVDHTSQHSAPGHPLGHGPWKALDLWSADRNLDRHVLAEFVAVSDLGSESPVEDEENVFVSHVPHLRTDGQVGRGG